MAPLGEFVRRLIRLVRRRRFDGDLAEEMQLHVDLRAAREAARGLSSADAVYAAYRSFGNTLRLREQSQDVWLWRCWDDLGRAVRDTLRSCRRGPVASSATV